MSKYYSKTTGGFYDTNIFRLSTDETSQDSSMPVMPIDAVAVSDATYAALFEAQAAGSTIGSDSNGNPISIAPTAPTNAQLAQTAVASGITITSTATPALNGTYACDANTTAEINAEVTSIILNGTFTDGTSTLAWPDVSNVSHSFTVAQFKTFATAVAAFVTGVNKYARGVASSLPSITVTIP